MFEPRSNTRADVAKMPSYSESPLLIDDRKGSRIGAPEKIVKNTSKNTPIRNRGGAKPVA